MHSYTIFLKFFSASRQSGSPLALPARPSPPGGGLPMAPGSISGLSSAMATTSFAFPSDRREQRDSRQKHQQIGCFVQEYACRGYGIQMILNGVSRILIQRDRQPVITGRACVSGDTGPGFPVSAVHTVILFHVHFSSRGQPEGDGFRIPQGKCAAVRHRAGLRSLRTA